MLRYTSKDGRLIPSHSILIGAWIGASLMGFLAVLAILIQCVRSIFFVLKQKKIKDDGHLVILLFFGLNLIWSFLFLPIPQLKITIPIMIAYIIALKRKYLFNKV